MRLFKKYPNRRLYDTETRSFTSLDKIKELILDNQPVKVVDSKSGSDITRSVLLQIIAEQEAQTSNSILTEEVLLTLIRYYGDSMQGMLREYIDRSLSMFAKQQDILQEQMDNLLNTNPLETFTTIAERNWQVWQDLAQNRTKK